MGCSWSFHLTGLRLFYMTDLKPVVSLADPSGRGPMSIMAGTISVLCLGWSLRKRGQMSKTFGKGLYSLQGLRVAVPRWQ